MEVFQIFRRLNSNPQRIMEKIPKFRGQFQQGRSVDIHRTCRYVFPHLLKIVDILNNRFRFGIKTCNGVTQIGK